MKPLLLTAALALATLTTTATAQSGDGVRVAPGTVCSMNKCLKFSSDLQSAQVQGRRSVSVAEFGLAANPVITGARYREIFNLALRQNNAGGKL